MTDVTKVWECGQVSDNWNFKNMNLLFRIVPANVMYDISNFLEHDFSR